jgi:putative DNA primase/helicase
LLKSEKACHIEAKQLDTNPFLLGVRNGTFDLKTGTLREPERGDMITKVAGCEFDPGATCPRWLAFLDRIMDGDVAMITYLRSLVGYTLSGDTSGQMLVLLYGTGQNGKSIFLEVVRDLLGDYGMSLRTEALSLKAFASKSGPSEDIARLMGARMVTVNETAEGMRFDEALIKDLTGGDTVPARRMYEGTIEYRPAFKIWIRGNHQPEFNGADGGMARRVRLIPFDIRIPDDEVDPQLRSKLVTELPGILNWAIEGARDWLATGTIATPEKVIEATEEYVEAMDGLAGFVEEQLIRDRKSSETTARIFGSYQQWCERSGIKFTMTQHKLSLRLKGRGFKPSRLEVAGKRVRGFIGVRLNAPFYRAKDVAEGII